MRQTLLKTLLVLGLLALLAACGQVITVTPTPTAQPSPTLELAAVATLPSTATPAPYTPEPTHTPTLTPTPIIHRIQAGESLLGIASRYGVSVAALQDANGILDPRSLQIGQQLIVPRAEEEEQPSQPGLGTPTPVPDARLRIENVYLSDTNIGGLFILGEVANGSDASFEQVKVGVTLLNKSGQVLSQAEGWGSLDLLDAGKHLPFAILLGETPAEFDSFQVAVLHAVPAYVGSYYRDLESRNLTMLREGYNSYMVTGDVVNIGPEQAREVYVVLTAYDTLSRVVATRKITPEANVLPPGSQVSFRAMLAPVGGPIVRVEAVAQGRRQR